MNTINTNSKQLYDVLTYFINNNKSLAESGEIPVALEIQGAPGLGKTSIIQQVASKMNIESIKLNLAQFDDKGELIGFPYKEYMMSDNNGNIIWVSDAQVSIYEKNGYSLVMSVKPRTANAAPEWIAEKHDPVILILDDWTRADSRFIQAVMELIATQKYSGWSLPKGSTIVLTSNPDDEHGNLVNEIDDAIRTRFISINLEFDVKCWADWAERSGLDNKFINFMLCYSDNIITYERNPRSMVNFFKSIKSIGDITDRNANELVTILGSASVGVDTVGFYKSFILNKLDYIPTPDDMMVMDISLVNRVLNKCIYYDGKYHPEVASIVSTRLCNYLLKKYEESSLCEDNVKRTSDILGMGLFTSDIISYVANTLIQCNMNSFAEIVSNSTAAKEILL